MSGDRRDVAGRSGDQAAHAVRDDDEVGERHVPDQALEEFGEEAAVLGDVKPGVVAEMDRLVPELIEQCGAGLTLPSR